MDTLNHQPQPIQHPIHNNPSTPQVNSPHHMSVRERIFHTNWGIVLIGALVAIGILAANIHAGQMEAAAETPNVVAENAAVLPVESPN